MERTPFVDIWIGEIDLTPRFLHGLRHHQESQEICISCGRKIDPLFSQDHQCVECDRLTSQEEWELQVREEAECQ